MPHSASGDESRDGTACAAYFYEIECLRSCARSSVSGVGWHRQQASGLRHRLGAGAAMGPIRSYRCRCRAVSGESLSQSVRIRVSSILRFTRARLY